MNLSVSPHFLASGGENLSQLPVCSSSRPPLTCSSPHRFTCATCDQLHLQLIGQPASAAVAGLLRLSPSPFCLTWSDHLDSCLNCRLGETRGRIVGASCLFICWFPELCPALPARCESLHLWIIASSPRSPQSASDLPF